MTFFLLAGTSGEAEALEKMPQMQRPESHSVTTT